MKRRRLITTGAALLASPLLAPRNPAHAETLVGVTDTEIKIGHTIAYSGPASSYGVIGKVEAAFWNMVNNQGGVAGRKINFISLDDGYSPPKTVEQVRRLVEQDQVAFLFNTLGTPTNSAIADVAAIGTSQAVSGGDHVHGREDLGQSNSQPTANESIAASSLVSRCLPSVTSSMLGAATHSSASRAC